MLGILCILWIPWIRIESAYGLNYLAAHDVLVTCPPYFGYIEKKNCIFGTHSMIQCIPIVAVAC
jgi:hypothetical protein